MSDFSHFPPGDPGNPRNFPEWRKWSIVGIIIPIDLTVSWGASGFSPAQTKFERDFGVSPEVLSPTIMQQSFGMVTLMTNKFRRDNCGSVASRIDRHSDEPFSMGRNMWFTVRVLSDVIRCTAQGLAIRVLGIAGDL
ncbi:MAG: hypothetical protein Q9159_007594 [Coniocarpon cinnabarinum]